MRRFTERLRGFESDRLMGTVLGLFGTVVLVVTVCGLIIGYYLGPVSPREGNAVCFDIPRHSSSADIAAILAENELIRSPLAFRVYARYTGADAALKAGSYEVPRGLSVAETIDVLRIGQEKTVSFTIPEGYNTAQVCSLLSAAGLIDEEEFLTAVSSAEFEYAFLNDLPSDERRLEGYLYPDTYQVREGSGSTEIIAVLLRRFDEEAEALDLTERAHELGMSIHEIVTIASLIEREARVDDDRGLISGVIHNRLRIGMPLQVDATVVYALGETAREMVLIEDLQVDSPYNTYMYSGLPPGPIANPGSASLRAALAPIPTDFLYYLAKPDGSHVFSRTLAEHNAAKTRYIP